jgi:periplasmic copper chaperone A
MSTLDDGARLLASLSMALLAGAALGGGAAAQSEDPGSSMSPMAPAASMASMAPTPSMAPVAVGDLTIDGAWSRTSPMVERAGAAYLRIRNGGQADDALVAAASDVAGSVELHETTEDDSGMMTMVPVESVPIPAGGQAVLEPGGYHIMLVDLVAPLEEGATFDLELTFQSGLTATVPVQVLGMQGMDMGAMASAQPMASMAP